MVYHQKKYQWIFISFNYRNWTWQYIHYWCVGVNMGSYSFKWLCFQKQLSEQKSAFQLQRFSLHIQYIPRNMHTVFALLCFVVVKHWLIFPYPSDLLHWHFGNLMIAPVPAKQPWWIWINASCEFIMNDCITTTKQSTTKPCAYFLGYTVWDSHETGLSL